jgi:hypothetical protein
VKGEISASSVPPCSSRNTARSDTTIPRWPAAGQVAHQLITALRSPAASATSQNVMTFRSFRLAIDGRLKRIRSLARCSTRPVALVSGFSTPRSPATRRASIA